NEPINSGQFDRKLIAKLRGLPTTLKGSPNRSRCNPNASSGLDDSIFLPSAALFDELKSSRRDSSQSPGEASPPRTELVSHVLMRYSRDRFRKPVGIVWSRQVHGGRCDSSTARTGTAGTVGSQRSQSAADSSQTIAIEEVKRGRGPSVTWLYR